MDPLAQAIEFLNTVVRPRAQDIDQDPEALREVLAEMGRRGLMALKRPTEYGGPALSESEFRKYQEEVARVSGTLAFLQTQHQSAVSMLARSENDELKSAYLPFMHDGTKQVGIGFSQLRRSGPPVMRAEPVDGGYLLDGHVPWVTGYTFFPEFLVGASLPSGQSLFAVVPLETMPCITVNPAMRLAAMEAGMTVTVDFAKYFVPNSQVAFVRPKDWTANNDEINIALQGHFAIGCALGSLDVLREMAEKKPIPMVRIALEALSDELEDCRKATELAQAGANDENRELRLTVRAWAIDLAVRCAHAAVTASSGAANSLSHPAQRFYREALVYTVSAQTVPVMEATLKRLIGERKLERAGGLFAFTDH
jgi:alkylation response protein AidB-like acyl-CoA dehydrogenase